jgi:hypothetical protein
MFRKLSGEQRLRRDDRKRTWSTFTTGEKRRWRAGEVLSVTTQRASAFSAMKQVTGGGETRGRRIMNIEY